MWLLCSYYLTLLLLAFFTTDFLSFVSNPFAFVGLWRFQRVDFGSNLTYFLFIDAGNLDFRLFRHFNFDALRRVVIHFMAETDLENQVFALQRSPETNALDHELLLVAV